MTLPPRYPGRASILPLSPSLLFSFLFFCTGVAPTHTRPSISPSLIHIYLLGVLLFDAICSGTPAQNVVSRSSRKNRVVSYKVIVFAWCCCATAMT